MQTLKTRTSLHPRGCPWLPLPSEYKLMIRFLSSLPYFLGLNLYLLAELSHHETTACKSQMCYFKIRMVTTTAHCAKLRAIDVYLSCFSGNWYFGTPSRSCVPGGLGQELYPAAQPRLYQPFCPGERTVRIWKQSGQRMILGLKVGQT